MLCVFGQELNLFSFVGLVKNNGIMMVDFALELMRSGKAGGIAPHEAMLEASVTRFHPIMMTTLAALLVTLPIALWIGAGAESRQPLGLRWWAGFYSHNF